MSRPELRAKAGAFRRGVCAVTITLTLTCDNAAFSDDAGAECARILRKLADDMATDGVEIGAGWNLRDVNGNKVGEVYANE